MFDFIIGLGQGGSRLAKVFYDGFDTPTVYMNLAGVDFTHMDIKPWNTFVLEKGGTGRDPRYGESVVREHDIQVTQFLDRKALIDGKYVLVCVGGGGGAGTGFLFPVLEYLVALGKEVLLVYTLPEKREGIPTKPNALTALDRLIGKYLQTNSAKKINVLLVDNDYCISKYGIGNGAVYDYWHSVNSGVVAGLKRFWILTQLDRFSSFIDMSAGYKALDANDVKRVVFGRSGYSDIRSLSFSSMSTEGLMRKLNNSSIVFGSLDIRTTKQYVVSIGIPMSWKKDPATGAFVEEIFQTISKATRHAPDVTRTSYFNSKLTTLQVNILLSGMAKSQGISKMIFSTEQDTERLAARGGAERLDIKKVSHK